MLQTVVSLSKNGPRALFALGFGIVVLYLIVSFFFSKETGSIGTTRLTALADLSNLYIDSFIGFVLMGLISYCIGLFAIAFGTYIVSETDRDAISFEREFKVFETGNGLLIQRYSSLSLQFEFISGLIGTLTICFVLGSIAWVASGVSNGVSSLSKPTFAGVFGVFLVILSAFRVAIWTIRSMKQIDELLERIERGSTLSNPSNDTSP